MTDLVRDQDVGDAGAGESLGFRDLLAADAARAAVVDLVARDIRGFVHLAVDAQAHAGVLGGAAHGGDIALEGVEVDDQRGGDDIGGGHADEGGGVVAKLGCGHGALLLANVKLTVESRRADR